MNARREAIEEYQKQRMFARLELQTQRRNAKMKMKEFQNTRGKFPGSNNLYNNYARQVNNSIEPNKVVNQFKTVYSNALSSELEGVAPLFAMANESVARKKFMNNQRNAAARAQAERNARAKARRNRFFQYFKRKPSNARAPPPSQAPPSGQFTPKQLKLLNTVLHNIGKIANMNEPYAREAKSRHNRLLEQVKGKNNIFLTKLTEGQLQKYRNNLNQI